MEILENNYKKKIDNRKKVAIVTSTDLAPIFDISKTPEITIYSILKKEYKILPGFEIFFIVNPPVIELFNLMKHFDFCHEFKQDKNYILYFEYGRLLFTHEI